jgi:hypothetical protein
MHIGGVWEGVVLKEYVRGVVTVCYEKKPGLNCLDGLLVFLWTRQESQGVEF